MKPETGQVFPLVFQCVVAVTHVPFPFIFFALNGAGFRLVGTEREQKRHRFYASYCMHKQKYYCANTRSKQIRCELFTQLQSIQLQSKDNEFSPAKSRTPYYGPLRENSLTFV